MNRVATITYIQNKILLPIRYEVSAKPHTVREVRDSYSNDSHLLEWDANGNLQYYYFRSPEMERWHCWDEDNRLQATSDNHYTAFYQYGADGNRALKLSGESQQMSNNGNYHYFAQLNQVTLYPSPHIVVDDHGYTKHYYADSERICSRIGGGGIEGLYLPTDSVTAGMIKDKQSANASQAAQAGQCAMASVNVSSNTLGIMADMQTVQSAENDIYFVHSDHLGSASWVTNLSGQPIQHLQYLPYGESYIDQRSSTFHERYTFTGKEKDSESGYYYFGARYFMPTLSIWSSVDPMADKYPSLSPYNYCAWNPMKIIDPMGDTLYIPGIDKFNHNKSEADIRSLVLKENAKYITINSEGRVDIDRTNITNSQISKDAGLALLMDLTLSSKKFLYEANDNITCSEIMEGYAKSMDDNRLGIVNASNNGKDASGGYAYLPAMGFDGHVIFAYSGEWTDYNGNNAKSSFLFHELAENYYKTDKGFDYYSSFSNIGAHKTAIKRERGFYGNPYPGKVVRQQKFPESKASYKYKNTRIW